MTKPLARPKQHVPVFVGSTYEDLKDYRSAVKEALHRLETIVRGMEYFGSKPGSPLEECLKAVRTSRVYVGIFAMRYGSIEESAGKSMTHLEYDEACRLDLPRLIYLLDAERQPVLPKYVETGAGAEKLEELKTLLKRNYLVSFFTTPEDLARRVTQDLPPILAEIGIEVDQSHSARPALEAKAVIERFNARPAKYAGEEIIVDCKITGEVRAVSEEDCTAFRLGLGDAIERRVESDVLGSYPEILAEKQMADWLESRGKGVVVRVRAKLLYGTCKEVEWSDDGPFTKKTVRKGYQVLEVISEDPPTDLDR